MFEETFKVREIACYHNKLKLFSLESFFNIREIRFRLVKIAVRIYSYVTYLLLISSQLNRCLYLLLLHIRKLIH